MAAAIVRGAEGRNTQALPDPQGLHRAVVFRAMIIDFAADWFDYRRLDGDSATPFLDSRVQHQPGGGPQ